MKLDREHKTEQLGRHVPGFLGYSVLSYLKTDLLLRRFLAGKVEEVRDRLADFLAAAVIRGRLRERLAFALKTTAFLKEEILPKPDETPEGAAPEPAAEERLLDFDLVLLEKVAALSTLLGALEAAATPEALAEAIGLFDEGLAEVDDLFRRRRQVLQGGSP